jgi:acyl-CoA thioesterase FadM
MPYGMVLEIDLTVRSIGTTSVSFQYVVRSAGDAEVRAEARTTVVCIDMDRFQKKPLPPDIRRVLGEYLEV